jgi:hypothetical protein
MSHDKIDALLAELRSAKTSYAEGSRTWRAYTKIMLSHWFWLA